uniref:Major facilitator superfamily (MFS) profile domain-containing protein n=1 Tax=Ditylenchus dipsaci TaxID=166011 RepID=A0A915EVQ8_9BILA
MENGQTTKAANGHILKENGIEMSIPAILWSQAACCQLIFFEPSKKTCELLNSSANINSTAQVLQDEFHSLLIEWGKHCQSSRITIYISSSVMLGAIVGSFLSGFGADRFGRKPALVGSLLVICLCNAGLVGLAHLDWRLACGLFFLLGSASGGYIVTNMVLLVEAIYNSRTRMLMVSLNGWPFGMMFCASLGYLTNNWRLYHLICSAIAVLLMTLLELFCKESVRWLVDRGERDKAEQIQASIEHTCFCCYSKSVNRTRRSRASIKRSPTPQLLIKSKSLEQIQTYTYLDLFRHKSISIPLFVLLFCFFSSSVVSFGLIFSAEILPGNRYANLAGMGLGKLLLGFIPYLISYWVGRRPIMLVSVGVACIACCSLIATWLTLTDSAHWLITVLGLILVASMDPTWKINHLYSIELFPTPVRNMARGLCSVMSRVGNLAGPFVIFLRTMDKLLPFYMFACLLVAQWLISFFLLPETKDTDLPQHMPKRRSKSSACCKEESSKCIENL